MALQYQPLRLVSDNEVPNFEALETQPLYGHSEIFSGHHNVITRDIGDVARAGDPVYGSTAHRLIRGVRALKSQVAAQEEIAGETDETRKMRNAVTLQAELIKYINQAVINVKGRRGSDLEATYLVDDYIEKRDQQMHERYSLTIASDSRLFYALQNGGELPMDGPIEEMILDLSGEMSRLEKNIKRDRLAMERLRFEWVSSVAIVEAIRKDARPPAIDPRQPKL